MNSSIDGSPGLDRGNLNNETVLFLGLFVLANLLFLVYGKIPKKIGKPQNKSLLILFGSSEDE